MMGPLTQILLVVKKSLSSLKKIKVGKLHLSRRKMEQDTHKIFFMFM